MEKDPAGKRKALTRMDLLLVLVLLAACGCLLLLRGRHRPGSVVRVYSDNNLLAELPLDRDDRFTVTTELGTNTVVVENGQAFVTDADCPDKICEQMGPVSRPGETIICLPHKLIAEVSNGE